MNMACQRQQHCYGSAEIRLLKPLQTSLLYGIALSMVQCTAHVLS